MKISGLEKGILALTLAFLFFCAGYFCGSRGSSEPYTVSAQTVWVGEVGALEADSAEANAAETGDAGTDAAETEPVEADPTETEAEETDPKETDPVETDPVETDPTETAPEGTRTAEVNTTEAGSAGGGTAKPEPETAANTGKININTATAEQLQTLPGIGEVRAAAIIADRQANGPFRIPEDITRVSGIGEGILAKILNYITVG